MSTSVVEPPTTTKPVLSARDLRVATTSGHEILHGVSFTLQPGKILALVGESGSGKTTAGLACLGHFRQGLKHTGGEVHLAGAGGSRGNAGTSGPGSILDLPEHERRKLRGGSISYVPQDPALSLNPAMPIGRQIREVLQVHHYGGSEEERRARVTEVLAEVGLDNSPAYQRRYPHQLSGGQQQRVGIAMAFACRPAVMVLDEPTTGLDVTTQALVLQTIAELAERHGVAGLYITHDLAVVAKIANEVVVMLSGEVVEQGPCAEVLYEPRHAYTRKLLGAVPDLAGKRHVGQVAVITSEHPVIGQHSGQPSGPGPDTRQSRSVLGSAHTGTDGDNLLEVSGLKLSYGKAQVLDGIEFSLARGESMMLLGESGSGKTTLSRCIAGLNDDYSGVVSLNGDELQPGTRARTAEQRQQVQYVFQSPFSSLNPRRTVCESVEVPLQMSGTLNRKQRRIRVLEALDQVRLGESYLDRRPGDLSGGQRQRVAIARALVNAPSLLVCDEITSALDVSVQASIIDLLRTLQAETGMSMLFVTHNICLARHISQRMAVLQHGRIVDYGSTEDVLQNPRHEYTRELLANVPTL
ncbi:ABC transporter ATP-binding protein [Pseudarthrobacter sp. J64]|uniref:ABC transporter ATP-binding protein n=1 Tax=Pseudarthrobacter sp. J64 TaxID=3116485 RepID=UPI002E80E512|nr:ABC transporter ATP-binding protein [Pseudarthrobacter sp. J64]MEE2570002.1 ABC transporter ATP-binding protein [Pseudarthrobacter sp. J64]